jgi:hypothetical protein
VAIEQGLEPGSSAFFDTDEYDTWFPVDELAELRMHNESLVTPSEGFASSGPEASEETALYFMEPEVYEPPAALFLGPSEPELQETSKGPRFSLRRGLANLREEVKHDVSANGAFAGLGALALGECAFLIPQTPLTDTKNMLFGIGEMIIGSLGSGALATFSIRSICLAIKSHGRKR